MNDIDIVYTMWANLKKTPSMEVNTFFIIITIKYNYIYKIYFICKTNSVILGRTSCFP